MALPLHVHEAATVRFKGREDSYGASRTRESPLLVLSTRDSENGNANAHLGQISEPAIFSALEPHTVQ